MRGSRIIVKRLHYPGLGTDLLRQLSKEFDDLQARHVKVEGTGVALRASVRSFLSRRRKPLRSIIATIVVEELADRTVVRYGTCAGWATVTLSGFLLALIATAWIVNQEALVVVGAGALAAVLMARWTIIDAVGLFIRKCIKKVAAEHEVSSRMAYILTVDWRKRIAVDPGVCNGQACVAGTRVMVSVVLENLAVGETPQAIADAYRVTVEDVQAALLYGAELAK